RRSHWKVRSAESHQTSGQNHEKRDMHQRGMTFGEAFPATPQENYAPECGSHRGESASRRQRNSKVDRLLVRQSPEYAVNQVGRGAKKRGRADRHAHEMMRDRLKRLAVLRRRLITPQVEGGKKNHARSER